MCILHSDFETVRYIIFICLPIHPQVTTPSVRVILMNLGKRQIKFC